MPTLSFRCEVCLREVTAAHCERHPHATVLDPSHPADAQWLEALERSRRQHRLKWWALLLPMLMGLALFTGWMWLWGVLIAAWFIFLWRASLLRTPEEVWEWNVTEMPEATPEEALVFVDADPQSDPHPQPRQAKPSLQQQ